MMTDEIKVRVNSYGPGRNLVMRWTDPWTGERKAKSAETTDRKAAERKAGELEKKLRAGKSATSGRISWQNFTHRVDDEVLTGQAPKTRRQTLTVFNRVEALVKPKTLADLTEGRISQFQAKLRSEGRSEATIRSYLAHLRSILSWAVDVKLISAVPAFPKLRREKKRAKSKVMKGRPIQPEEYQAMLNTVPTVVGEKAASSWQFFIRGLWWSGLRLGESLNLYWDRRDRICVETSGEHPVFWIPARCQKSGKDEFLPMAPEFAALLESVRVVDRHGPVFKLPGIVGKTGGSGARSASGIRDPDWVSRIVCRIGKDAGIVVDEKDVLDKNGKPIKKLKFASAHDLRRAFGERWSERILPKDLQLLMRHESIDTTMSYYVGQNAQRTADAVWKAYERVTESGNTLGNTAPQNVETDEKSLS
jgi:integrase